MCGLTSRNHALELRDLRKASARPRSSAAPTWRCAPGERVAIIGPNSAEQVPRCSTSSAGALVPTSGECCCNGQRIDGKKAVRDQPPGLSRSFQITTSFPSSACSRTCAAACCGAWATATLLAFLSRLQDANERAEQLRWR